MGRAKLHPSLVVSSDGQEHPSLADFSDWRWYPPLADSSDGEAMRMNKSILRQYMHAEELLRHTERQIKRLKAERELMLSDVVKGSNPNYPYEARTFHIEGYGRGVYTGSDIKRLEAILNERQKTAAALRLETEAWMNTLPPKIQLIVQVRYLDGETWDVVARKVGKGCTRDSIRMEFRRYMAEIGETGLG